MRKLGCKHRGNTPMYCFRCPSRLMNRIKRAARRDRRNVSDFIRLALENCWELNRP